MTNANYSHNSSDNQNVEKRVNSIVEYLEEVFKIVENAQNEGNVCVFRGHASKNWKLISRIGRDEQYSKEYEKRIFLEFKRLYHPYTSVKPQNDMDVLALGQHYGLHTRLLDWTYNPLIALYFACISNSGEDGAIYYYEEANNMKEASPCNSNTNAKNSMPCTMNDIQVYENDFLLVPDYIDIRFKNQQALFLFCANPKEEVDYKDRIFISSKAKKEMMENLALLGFNESLVYPSLDSLCKDIMGTIK